MPRIPKTSPLEQAQKEQNMDKCTPQNPSPSPPSSLPPLFRERKLDDTPVPLPLLTDSEKHRRYNDLVSMVHECTACPETCTRTHVLTWKNGNVQSDIMFIAEAPGKNGADRTSIPIYGDPTGDNFTTLLSSINLKREQVFVTNAVLCNPRDEQGNNRTPSDRELRNCSFHLQSTIFVVQPKIIVTLGSNALEALNLIEPHNQTLSSCIGQTLNWFGIILIPLYHPSPRALLHRNMDKQRRDFQLVKQVLDYVRSSTNA